MQTLTGVVSVVGSTKAAMDMFTKSMALELGPYKVSDGQGWLLLLI